MIRRNIPDSPTFRGQQGDPELIRGLTDLCESAPFLHPRKRQQQQQKRRSLRRFSFEDVFLLKKRRRTKEELKAGFMC